MHSKAKKMYAHIYTLKTVYDFIKRFAVYKDKLFHPVYTAWIM